MTLYRWSQTAATNGTADSTINWAEGQAPSTINDSARGMMAAVAKHRDDISGQIATSGTSTAYIVSSFQGFDTLTNMHGKEVWFTPHTTNGATVTLNVDSLGGKPLRSAPGVELQSGVMIQGTPVGAIYNNTDGAWYLKGNFNSYGVPFLGGLDYWDTVTPGSAFIFPAGQAINRVTFAAAFARWGTTYGAGDGSTTFNAPDKTGRVSAMKEAVGTRLTSSGTGNVGIDGGTMGSAGGGAQTLLTANLPPQTPAGSVSSTFTGIGQVLTVGAGGNLAPATGSTGATAPAGTVASAFTGTAFAGQNSTPVKVAQPTIICNYIIRVL